MASNDPDTAGLTPVDELVAFLDTLGHRHPVIRTGERQPIPWPVRLAVLIRDGNTCGRCGSYVRTGAELDHIKPWSAGGSDRSDNLRTMCHPCNQDRSNYAQDGETPRQAVTWWCSACWTEEWPSYVGIPVLGSWESVANADTYDLAINAVRSSRELVLAFCARCDRSGYTRWVL